MDRADALSIFIGSEELMIEGCAAKISMYKVLKKDMILDTESYICKVEDYDSQDDKFTIKMQDSHLIKLSLEAKYQCEIDTDDMVMLCECIVKERYQCEKGSMAVLYIENGFYEKTVE